MAGEQDGRKQMRFATGPRLPTEIGITAHWHHQAAYGVTGRHALIAGSHRADRAREDACSPAPTRDWSHRRAEGRAGRL